MKKDEFAVHNTALMADPQLTVSRKYGTRLGSEETILPGVTYLEEGRVRFAFYAPNASKVEIKTLWDAYEMEKTADGNWVREISFKVTGFTNIDFIVDGTAVLNPMAPIGFGASCPINFIDIPSDENDFCYLKDVPHGSVCEEYYYSDTTKGMCCCEVYLPAEYCSKPEKKYPVLYLQHGHGENEKCWIYQGKANFIMDNLIAQGKAEPMILVMNNGMIQMQDKEERYLNTDMLAELLAADCIPFIEKRYRVKDDPSSRAVAGLSMGSMQAVVAVFLHPELFAYAGSFSGFVQAPAILRQPDPIYLRALNDPEQFKKDCKILFRAVGDEDALVLPCFKEDDELLKKCHLSPKEFPGHIARIYRGNHEWNVWRQCLRDFAQLLFR